MGIVRFKVGVNVAGTENRVSVVFLQRWGWGVVLKI